MSAEMKHVSGPYITFVLGREEYGISFERVHEILGPEGIQNAEIDKPCLKGMMKLRNHKMPIVDLACRFGLEKNDRKGTGAILVTVLGKEGGMVGLFVDAIRQVLHVQVDCLKPSSFGPEDPRVEFITEAAHIQGRVISLLNFDRGMELFPALATFEVK